MGYATAIPFVIVKGFILADLTFHVGKLLSQAAPSTQFLPSALAEVGALKEGDEVWIREDQLPHPIQVLLINGRNLIVGGAEDKWYRQILLFLSVLRLNPTQPERVRNIAVKTLGFRS